MLFRRSKCNGFTLIEMITVIVLLGIIAGILTPFISKAMQAYTHSKARASLVAKGRLAMERLAREVRLAVPNSLVVLTSVTPGDGIEFLRSRAGGRYVERFDSFGAEFANTTLRFRKNANMSNLYILGLGLSINAGELLVIGNTSPADLLGSPPDSVVSLTSVSNTNPAAWPVGDGTAQGQILNFSTSRQFRTESPGRHFSIADQTIEVGLSAANLRWFSATGLSDYDGAVDWSGSDPSLTDSVSAISFIYAPGNPQSTGVLRVDLQLTDAATNQSIQLYREIHVRNTP
jgi:MSHA biogenesis protein MshO